MNALLTRLKNSLVSALAGFKLKPDVQALEQILLSAALAGGGVPGALRAVIDGLPQILPGAPDSEVALARVALSFALSALHVQSAAVAGFAAAPDEGEDDGDEGEGEDDPRFLEDKAPAAPVPGQGQGQGQGPPGA